VNDSTDLSWDAPRARRRTILEIWIVLGLSLGASALYSIIAVIQRLFAEKAIADQSALINVPLASQPVFDLIYQVLGIITALVPVALALYLFWTPTQNPFRRIGLDFSRFGRDTGKGFGLAALIGIPGIAFYLVGHALGITVKIVPTALGTYWWTVPVLILVALRAALEEEVIVVGYLFTRLRELGWKPWLIIITSAVLRGSYHLYQGFGPFLGNAVMGVIFGMAYQRWGRVMPLVIAHFILDVVSFVGYPIVAHLAPGFLPGT
jgi:membrane protease YdiL (CAAX protease family)